MRSAIELTDELLLLPDGCSVRAWAAHAGLDVRAYQSGTGVKRPRRISRASHACLRRTLCRLTHVAMHCDPPVRASREKLIAEHKKNQWW